MKVNVLNERVSFNDFDVINHKKNTFIIDNTKDSFLTIGDYVTVTKIVDNTVFYYNAQVHKIDGNKIHADYSLFNTSSNLREHPRETVDFSALSSFSNGSSLNIDIMDISKFGLKIKTKKEFPRITADISSKNEIFVSLFGKSQKMKIVWRKNTNGYFYYGLQKIMH